MIKHSETIHLPYSVKDLHDLVLTIEDYPRFIPWCSGARILRSEENKILADLVVSYKFFTEKYTSEVTHDLIENNEAWVDVKALNGPFEHLDTYWHFKLDHVTKQTLVKFDINFKFKSKIFESLLAPLFNKAIDKIMAAFTKRAAEKLNKIVE